MTRTKTSKPLIVGAGLSGLIAGVAFPASTIVEAGSQREAHKALLRFRSDKVAKLTNIPFRKVTVRKGIVVGWKFVEPDIGLSNKYARKVIGLALGDRSIWNLAPVDRYIAPDNFIEQLQDQLAGRIDYNNPFDFTRPRDFPIISTVPLPMLMEQLGIERANVTFVSAGIKVVRCKLRDVSLFQTIYFPEDPVHLYRASITDDTLIMEFTNVRFNMLAGDCLETFFQYVTKAFGLSRDCVDEATVEVVDQRYGKIVDINPDARREILYRITQDFGVYSLGRFATYRNILLDDVVEDIAAIRRMMSLDAFSLKMKASEKVS